MADRDPAALRALPARTWALLLRELRAELDGAGGAEAGGRAELDALVRGPRSAVASGPGRDRVARLLADDPELRARLAARPVLAGAAAALGAGTTTDDAPADPAAPADPGAAPTGGGASAELRAKLARTRRQRDGAEVRARSAEDRAAAAESAAALARATIADLEARLAAAEAEPDRAAARATRRANDRLRELDAALSRERAERERLTRALARAESDRDRLRSEVARLEAATADRTAPVAAAPAPVRRPVGLPDGIAPDTTEAARHLLGAVELVVVDGYNLTLRVRSGLDLAGQRRWLLERCRPLVARGLRVVVVFDGDGETGTRRLDVGVDVRFTPERTIADDEIEFVVGEAAGGGPTLVVTDDAELRRRVAAHDADVVAVLPFVGALG